MVASYVYLFEQHSCSLWWLALAMEVDFSTYLVCHSLESRVVTRYVVLKNRDPCVLLESKIIKQGRRLHYIYALKKEILVCHSEASEVLRS